MSKSVELCINIFIAIVLIVGGIGSAIVALYPKLSLNEDRYQSGDVKVTQTPQPYIAADSKKISLSFVKDTTFDFHLYFSMFKMHVPLHIGWS